MPNLQLTVLVPTRDRADTLLHCLKTILAQPNENMEILVSDNFSSPETKQVFDSFSDKRLRYIRTSERMGMSEHWDFALSHVTGDWVTVIGDDDGLLPNAVDKFFAIANANPEIKAITFMNCWYRWPLNDEGGKLSIIKSKGYEVRDCKDSLIRTMKGEIIVLPAIYTGGFVKTEVLTKIRELSPNKQLIHSMIPDVYCSMAFASVLDKYIYCNEPVAIAGSSKHSNGRQHKNKSHEQMKQLDFYKENKKKFHPILGDGATEAIQMLIYECFLQSSHLRADNLGVTTQDQLVVALVHAGHRVRQRVTDYCRQVAKLNNLDFAPILAEANRQKPAYKIKKMARKLARHIPYCSKLPRKIISDPSIKTVYDASIRISQELAA